MSKLDTFTVIIVGLCLAALGYLVYKTVKLRQLKNASPTSSINLEESTPSTPSDTLTFDDEGRIVDPATAEDGDLDDEQLNVNNGTLVEEEEGAALEEENTAATTSETAKNEPSAAQDEVPTDFDTNASSTGDFMVLAGSFRQRSNAEAQVRRLKQLGFDEARVANFNGGSLAVALVGRFDDYDKATQLANKIEAKGIDAFVKGKK